MTNLPTKRIKAISHASNFQCFTYNTAAKTSLHRQEKKLCHCHPIYKEQKCADTTGTVLVFWAVHFQHAKK